MHYAFFVESPNKVKTIQGLLKAVSPHQWSVKATVGHITELANDGESNLGFDITQSAISCRYVPRKNSKGEAQGARVIQDLKAIVQKVDAVYVATDPDREGEGIGWHVVQQVCGNKPVHRVVYSEITEAAIKKAIEQPRQLDLSLVSAQRARQCLDKLVGYGASDLVREAGGGGSAGRVQSAALHLLCDLERKIVAFKPTPYWALFSEYGEGFRASYLGAEATGGTADAEEEPIDESADPAEATETDSKRVLSEAEANKIVAIAQQHPHQVIEFSARQSQKSPSPPLTTSSMQQAAGVRHGFSSDRTMKLAQELFEGMKLPDGSTHGAITYHRTDSVTLSAEFQESVRQWLQQNHPTLVPDKAKPFKDKAGAQSAHEAIRPVDVAFTPERMKSCLSDDQLKLYTLIWQRTVASQCAAARFDRTRVVIQAGSTFWEARGAVMTFAGFTTILGSLEGDVELPKLAKGQSLGVKKVWHEARKTTPPGRFSEPRLVQTLERLGIGRPSTFANIISTLKFREYVKLQGKAMIPTEIGMKTDEVLMQVLPVLIDARFTAKMEEALDQIASGGKNWEHYLIDFNFNFLQPALTGSGAQAIAKALEARRVDRTCPTCSERLITQPRSPKFAGDKDHFLRCAKRCEGIVYFWNTRVKDWVKLGDKVDAPPPTPGKPTEFVCQVCGKLLEAYSYMKDGQSKSMLRCADSAARSQPDHKNEVYFLTQKGSFWSPATGLEPSTAKLSKADLAAAIAANQARAGKSASKGGSSKAAPTTARSAKAKGASSQKKKRAS